MKPLFSKTVFGSNRQYDLRFDMLQQHSVKLSQGFATIIPSFARDQLGGGLEFSLNNIFMLRGGYKVDLGDALVEEQSIYSGLSAGASIVIPVSKKEDRRSNISIDYAYRQTTKWNATHNIGLRFGL